MVLKLRYSLFFTETSQDDAVLWILLFSCPQVEIFFRAWLDASAHGWLSVRPYLYRAPLWGDLSRKMKFLHSGRSHSDASGRVWMPAMSADAMHFVSLWCWHRDSDVISERALELFPKKVAGKSSARKSQSTLPSDDANLLFFPLICLQYQENRDDMGLQLFTVYFKRFVGSIWISPVNTCVIGFFFVFVFVFFCRWGREIGEHFELLQCPCSTGQNN